MQFEDAWYVYRSAWIAAAFGYSFLCFALREDVFEREYVTDRRRGLCHGVRSTVFRDALPFLLNAQ
jgi:hypothetical protein